LLDVKRCLIYRKFKHVACVDVDASVNLSPCIWIIVRFDTMVLLSCRKLITFIQSVSLRNVLSRDAGAASELFKRIE